jgi:hypothetical protein
MSIMSFTAIGTPCRGAAGPADGGGEHADHRVQRRPEAERSFVGGQELEVGDLTGSLAPLDRADQLSGEGGQGAVQVAKQVVDLRLPLADHQVAVDAAVRLRAPAVEGGQAVQGALEVSGIEAVEALRVYRRLS